MDHHDEIPSLDEIEREDPPPPPPPRSPLNSPTSHSEEKTSFPSLDETIEHCIGSLGRAQLFQAIFVSLAWAFDAQQVFISIFSDKKPSWHCLQANSSCSSATTPCGLPNHAWAWDQPARTTVVSEWGLMCATPFVTGLPMSAFFIGCFAGGLVLATLADSLGRKNMLIISCLIMSIAGVVTYFSPNVWVYSALRFMSGFGRASIGACALVLSTEFIGKKWRGQVGILCFFCFTIGFLSLPVMAYLSRGSSWRNLYLFTSVPTIFYCVLIKFLVHESPRWLFVRGRREEAIQTLASIAKSNGKMMTCSFSNVPAQEESCNVNLYSAIMMLWKKRWAFRRISAVMFVSFGVGLLYYGMPLGLSNLSFNLYLSATFNALSELPSAVLALFLIGILNRRSTVLAFTTVSGVCSMLCVFLDSKEKLQMGVEVVSLFSACSTLNILMIYIIELFPTTVRNSAVSLVRLTLVLGGVFSPLLLVAGRKNRFLSYGVFGLVVGVCGLFVTCLPETRGRALSDTMQEEESKEGESASQCCP